jgi:hypothetical protein
MDFNEQLFELIGLLRRNRQASKAASTKANIPEPRSWFMDKNGKIVSEPIVPQKDPCVSMSLGKAMPTGKAGSVSSVPAQENVNVNKARVITEFLFNR